MSTAEAALFVGAAAVLGLIFGSFATVAAYRIPKRETIVHGRSRCTNCGRTIRAIDNIPLFSYLVLQGRCRHCGARISPRYPLIEVAVGALFAGTAAKFGVSVNALVFAAFFWVLVVLTVIDLEYKLLPNRVVYPTFVVGWAGLALAALIDGDVDSLFGAAVGVLIFAGFLFVVAFIAPAGMGMGDVKLAAVLGTFLGYLNAPELVLAGMFFSFVCGGIIGVVVLMRGGSRKTQVPFGPYLALGTTISIFAGEPIVDAYLNGL